MRLPVIDLKRWRVESLSARLEHHPDSAQVRLTVVMQAKNVETGEMGPVMVQESAAYEYMRDPEFVKSWVRRSLMNALIHELDECLRVDGVQLVDPHARDKRAAE